LEVADIREKVMVLMPALGGFREETLSKLEYRHVREDLEANRTPIHISVEIEIVKGKYGSYDAFLGGEGADYLKLYLESRRRGSPYTRNGAPEIPPEDLTDESPLIRDTRSPVPRSIGPKQFRKIVHHLYLRAGIIKEQKPKPGAAKNSPRIMYDVRFHSLRKFFKTQMVAAGVPESHVEYFMGHISDTYNDIQALGIEKLRSIYSSANLTIRPKTTVSKIEMIREFARAVGVDPNKVQVEPDTKYVDPEERERFEIRQLMREVRNELLKPQTG
jgi:integrase